MSAGDVITMFVTGEGQTSPAGVDGQLAAPPFPKPLLPVHVRIGGQEAVVQYAGGAPGLIAGLMQVNAVVPAAVHGDAVPIEIQVGSAVSPPGVTLAVR